MSLALSYTVFEDKNAQRAQSLFGSWEDLVSMVRDPEIRSSKEDCRLLKLATFGNRRTSKNALRSDSNIEHVSGCEGDYDGGVMGINEATMLLAEHNIEALLYTSASHCLELPRWRVLLPFSKEYPKEDRAKFLARANGALKGVLGDESFAPSQSYYFGRVQDAAAYEVQQTRGICIDLLPALDGIAIGKKKKLRNGHSRADRIEHLQASDPVIRRLRELELVKTLRLDGAVDITCPFASEHTQEGGASATTYFPGATGGYAYGNFCCLHSHCLDRSQHEYLRALGLTREDAKSERTVDTETGEIYEASDFESVLLADVKVRPVDWLFPGKFAIGKLSFLCGHPGLGKSTAALSIAAIVSRGHPWPVDGTAAPVGNVLVLSAEDDVEDTLGPRLLAAGADPQRVHILKSLRDGDKRRSLNLERDVARLRAKIREVGDVLLVIVDPISAFLGRCDAHNTAEVRGVLAPLCDMAAELKTALLGISHLNKARDVDAILRMSGSLAFVAQARAVYVVGEDKNDKGRKLVACLKNNLAIDSVGFAYRIGTRGVQAGDVEIRAARIEWEDEPLNMTVEEVLDGPDKGGGAREDAATFLEDTLADGPCTAKFIEARAGELGHAWRTVRRAADELHVVKSKGEGGVSFWGLP